MARIQLYQYTFVNRCKETNMPLDDGTAKVFLSTKGTNAKNVPQELVQFLKYVENSTDECAAESKSGAVRQIHKRVSAVKRSREWEQRYMKFEELLQKEHKEGIQEGLQEGLKEGRLTGETRMLELVNKMTAAGESDKIPQLTDRDFLEEIYRKYQLD